MGLIDQLPLVGGMPFLDAGWLLAEAPEHPTHVGGLLLFEPPPEAGDDWTSSIVEDALRFEHVRPPYDQQLVHPHGRLGTYEWKQAEDFDLTYHVRHLALPAPGRVRELLSLVSRLHTPMLDRHRPLWEATFIEGLEDGRVALYWKVSHSVMDGVAAMKQLFASLTPDPDVRDLPPPWAEHAAVDDGTPRGDDSQLPPSSRDLSPSLGDLAAGLVGQAASSFRLGQQLSIGALRTVARRTSVKYPAPNTILNSRLTSSRRFVGQSYDIDRFKSVASATGATINDVVLAVCGGALRTYLSGLGELPDEPLIAMVPVSVRPADGGDRGNAISATLTTLATDVRDPLERLEAVRAGMDHNKARMAAMSRAELTTFGTVLFSPALGAQLTGNAGRLPPLFNVVISNVPGPREPLYWNGARLDGMYPASLLFDGYALNITQTSYAGSFEFGITADRMNVPSVQRLIDDIDDALTDLQAALGV